MKKILTEQLKKWKIVSSILFLIINNSFGQDFTVKGKVVSSEDNIGVPGINILVLGTSHGTITNVEGEFELAASPSSVLVFSGIGYLKQEVAINSKDNLDIVLQVDTKELDEVVVIGYGTQKKSDLTGAVASIQNRTIETQPVASIDNALQGAAPGVQVTQTSGQPGGGVSIRVRGSSSIQGGNEPLFVIDGFPIYNNSVSAGVTSGANLNPLASINPSDIESIDILKDASATAIYGSRGANGVILITTKRGRANKSDISYEGSYGLQSIRQQIEVLDAQGFARLRNEALFDRNPSGGSNQYLSNEEIRQLGKGIDWQKEATQVAPIQSHQVSFSGGSEKTRYLISGNYFNQEGIIKNTGFERFSSRINLETDPSQKLTIGLNLTGSKSEADIAPSGLINALLLMPPTATIYEPDGSYTLRNPFENIISNPIASLYERTNNSTSYKLLGTVYGDYQLTEDLTFRVSFGTDINNIRENSYLPRTLFEGVAVDGEARIGNILTNSWLNENTLNYNKSFNSHHINALLGFTQQEFRSSVFRAGAQQFVSDDLLYHSLQSGAIPMPPHSNETSWALLSYLARFNYNYDQKYYISATLRADGSSKFGIDNKWGYFPSVALAWKLNNEEFFSPLSGTISDLKIRSSFGSIGNQEIGVFQSLSTLSSVRLLLGDSFVTGFVPDRITNNGLGWETTNQLDLGLDVGLFANRILLNIDGYYKRTHDLLLNVQIPWTTGHSASLQNYGSVENKGFELGVSTVNTQGTFSWTSNLNFSLNRNKVLTIGRGDDDYIISGNNIIKVGQPLGTFFGAVTDGVLQVGEEDTRGPMAGLTNPKPGDRVFKDIDGDGSFTTGGDRDIIGNAQPDFIFGLNNNFQWKGFDLFIFFQGVVGNKILNSNRQVLEMLTGQQNAVAEAAHRWSETNPNSDLPRASVDARNIFHDRFVEDGSFIRLKNITLGYTLPSKFTNSVKVSNVRLFVTGQNLLTWTRYTGYDPEVTSANNTISQGVDSGVYPIARTVTTGVKVNF